MALQGTEMRAEAALSLCSASEANLLWPFVRRCRAASVVATIAVNLAIRPERIAHPSNAFLPLTLSLDPGLLRDIFYQRVRDRTSLDLARGAAGRRYKWL